MPRRRLCVVLLAATSLCGTVTSAEPSEAELFAAQVRKITGPGAKSERPDALDWLLRHCAQPQAVGAMPVVERCLEKEADSQVRAKAVEVLGMTAYQQKPKVCPLVVVRSLLDRDADVCNIAAGCCGMFRNFAPGTLPVVLECASHSEPSVRSNAMWLLAMVAPTDDKARQALEAGRTDKDFEVRCDAHTALFRVTGKLDDVVPFLLRMFAEAQDLPEPQTEAEKAERPRRNLRVLGGTMFLRDLGEKRPEDVARFLLAALKDDAASLRRGAADCIMLDAKMWELEKKPPSESPFAIPGGVTAPADLPDPLAKAFGKDKKPLTVPRLLVRLRELGVEARLKEINKSDPDEKVRARAALALKTLSTVRENQVIAK